MAKAQPKHACPLSPASEIISTLINKSPLSCCRDFPLRHIPSTAVSALLVYTTLTMRAFPSSKKLLALRTPQVPISRKVVQQRGTAMSASRVLYVKGDPENKVLGDCPFCHRVLLTLELKVCPDYQCIYVNT